MLFFKIDCTIISSVTFCLKVFASIGMLSTYKSIHHVYAMAMNTRRKYQVARDYNSDICEPLCRCWESKP